MAKLLITYKIVVQVDCFSLLSSSPFSSICAARMDTHFWTSSLTKGMLLAMLIKNRSNFSNICIETQTFGDLGLEKAKIWQFWNGKRQIMALLM